MIDGIIYKYVPCTYLNRINREFLISFSFFLTKSYILRHNTNRVTLYSRQTWQEKFVPRQICSYLLPNTKANIMVIVNNTNEVNVRPLKNISETRQNKAKGRDAFTRKQILKLNSSVASARGGRCQTIKRPSDLYAQLNSTGGTWTGNAKLKFWGLRSVVR